MVGGLQLQASRAKLWCLPIHGKKSDRGIDQALAERII
jgi:hypothetical protein